MRNTLLSLIILAGVSMHAPSYSAVMSYDIQTHASSSVFECPTLNVECPDETHNKDSLTFKLRVLEGEVPKQNISYEWKVSGGEIKSGQGTDCITVVNFDVEKKSLHVSVEVSGLPEGCPANYSCTIVV